MLGACTLDVTDFGCGSSAIVVINLRRAACPACWGPAEPLVWTFCNSADISHLLMNWKLLYRNFSSGLLWEREILFVSSWPSDINSRKDWMYKGRFSTSYKNAELVILYLFQLVYHLGKTWKPCLCWGVIIRLLA